VRRLLSAVVALTAAVPFVLAHGPGPAAPPHVSAVVVNDVTVKVAGQDVPMYVVEPSDRRGHARAGILFLHWFAPGTVGADRTEYLAEAVKLAKAGTVSYLPQGGFPWLADPVGTDADARAIRGQLAVFRTLLHRLAGRDDVDRKRVAVVGHDYGAMYAALLAHDDAVHATVLETADSTWENWFLKFWLGFEGEEAARYTATFAGLEPVDAVHGLGSRLYLQFADDDFFIPEEVRASWAASAAGAKIDVYAAEHELNTAAATDRQAWLRDELRLAQR
jgi:acetyl esterase/lipase